MYFEKSTLIDSDDSPDVKRQCVLSSCPLTSLSVHLPKRGRVVILRRRCKGS